MTRRLALLLALLLAAAGARPAAAQFYALGRNKIQYRSFDWRVLRGPHVDLYFYRTGETVARAALDYAEASYDTLALEFGHEVGSRVPIIVYASHTDFEQTNILPFLPPEGLLGVTEFLKGRVTLPFRGNLAEFRHTLRHELVHVFQLSLAVDNYYLQPRAAGLGTPLWWTEGLAELWSAGEDARDQMILRDLVVSGRLPTLPQLRWASGGIVYPLGGRIHRWLADTYGDWRVALFYREANRYASFEDAIQAVYGKSLEALSDEWQLAMRRAYGRAVDTLGSLAVSARPLARYAVKAVPLADTAGGVRVAYTSAAYGYPTIYERPLAGGGARPLVRAGDRAEREDFHAFDSRLDGSRPGYLLFSTRFGDRDALVVWDLSRRRAAGRYQFPDVVTMLSPRWLPDGSAIVFSGIDAQGLSDLYRLDLATGALAPLTRDPYQDLDPSPSPDGSALVFASDRAAGGLEGARNLFVLELATGRVRPLTQGAWVDEAPWWAADGRVYFTSDRDGVLNAYSVDSSGAGRQETAVYTGVFDAVPLPGGRGLVVGGFDQLGFNVYRYAPDSAAQARTFPSTAADTAPAGWEWPAGRLADSSERVAQPYRQRYTIDFAAGDVVVTPGFGGASGITVYASDLIGDHRLVASVGTFGGGALGSALSNINANVIYLNQHRRLNWGLGAFRFAGRAFDGDQVPAYEEKSVGGLGFLRYPLSAFTRVEGTTVVEYSKRVDFVLPVDQPERNGLIVTNLASWVFDNALWVESGPLDGTRVALTGGLSSDLSNRRFDSWLGVADVRRYFRFGRRSAYAFRALGFWSDGDRPRRTNIGGTLAMRGYPLFGALLGTRAWMVNQEVRTPILRYLTLGTPLGDVRFPEVQGAVFFDLGRAWDGTFGERRGVLGSYGSSFRMALAPLLVLRLDLGWRFGAVSDPGYGLSEPDRKPFFLKFFFGYNY